MIFLFVYFLQKYAMPSPGYQMVHPELTIYKLVFGVFTWFYVSFYKGIIEGAGDVFKGIKITTFFLSDQLCYT